MEEDSHKRKRREIAEFLVGLNNVPFINYIFIDLDNCQKYNEYYGHKNVDIFIENIHTDLNELAKSNQGKCIRSGGDEYTLIIPSQHIDKIEAVGPQANKAIKNINLVAISEGIDGSSIPEECKTISASIASVLYPISEIKQSYFTSKVEDLEQREVKMLWELTDVMMWGIKSVRKGQCITLDYTQ